MSHLFSPLTLRGLTIKNRAWLSPMCQYSAVDGIPNDWHLVHLGSRAVGGCGLIMAEKTAVEPGGRITTGCTGIWSPAHAEAWAPITDFMKRYGATPGIQLGHAGKKASCYVPWSPVRGGVPLDQGGWVPRGVNAEKFVPQHNQPAALTEAEIALLVEDYRLAAELSLEAGFEVAEIHSAHGYLLHQFYSPLSNTRNDAYGGSYEARIRLTMEVARAVRTVWPERLPVFIRLSTTDWVEGGWTIEDSIDLVKRLKAEGVDLVDCSSGGATLDAPIPVGPGYQVHLAEQLRREAEIPVATVGGITTGAQAEAILAEGRADAVMIGKAMLDDPYWAIHAARELGVADQRSKEYSWVKWP